MSNTSQTRPRSIGYALGVLCIAIGLFFAWKHFAQFPPETTPEGAYYRIAYNVGRGEISVVFSYLEDDAQHAVFTIVDYRKKTIAKVTASYPEPERSRLIAQHKDIAQASDVPNAWTTFAMNHGYIETLRKDLSGMKTVEQNADRATIETTRGTRYSFRRRANGMWGMTLFTAELVAEAERAARDYEVIQKASTDYSNK